MNRTQRRATERARRSAKGTAAEIPLSKLLRAARQKEKLACPNSEVVAAYVEAAAFHPTRAEPLHGAARFCRMKGLYEQGYQFAKQGLQIPKPYNTSSADTWIYEYGLLDELAVTAYWIERYSECVDACHRLLTEGRLPNESRDRALKNKQFALDKLQEVSAKPVRRDYQATEPEVSAPGSANGAPLTSELSASEHTLFCRDFAVRTDSAEAPNREADNRSDGYRHDASIISQALELDFLARDHREAGQEEKAVEYFVRRARLGYLADEIFVFQYRAAQLQEAMGQPFGEVLAAYQRASDAVPARAEALYGASRLCRMNNRFADGYEFAKRGLKCTLPADGLFVQAWIYQYGLLDELAICASWIGRYRESLDACQRLLSEGKIPHTEHDRVAQNAALAKRNIVPAADLAEPVVESSNSRDRFSCQPQLTEEKTERNRLKVLLICGPWGGGTSMIAGLLELVGASGLEPYFATGDPRTPNSYESIPFMDTILPYVHLPTVSRAPSAVGSLKSSLQILQRRIRKQEFSSYDPRSGRPIFLKHPASALLIPEICEVFETKLIYVMRPLEDVERTRLRRRWLPYLGSAGAAIIYQRMAEVQEHHVFPTLTIDYNYLLLRPAENVRELARFSELHPSPTELDRAIGFVGVRP